MTSRVPNKLVPVYHPTVIKNEPNRHLWSKGRRGADEAMLELSLCQQKHLMPGCRQPVVQNVSVIRIWTNECVFIQTDITTCNPDETDF